MSNGSRMSVLGLYNWDNRLFDPLAVPEGFTPDDKTTLVNNIILECAELEVLYPNVDFFKFAIESWSEKEVITWNRIYSASLLEYNPIENYNRVEITDVQNRGAMTHSGKDSIEGSGTDTDKVTGYDSDVGSGSDTDTGSVVGYDSNSFVNRDKNVHQAGTTITHNKNTSVSRTKGSKDTTSYGHIVTDSTGHKTDSHISGNIGVTTSQQMLEQELSIAPKLNIMNIIIESFKNRFCLLVY